MAGHDIGSFQRINIGRWPMGGFLTSSFQQLERTSSSSNLAKKSTTNTNRLGNEMHSSQDGQYNGVCDTQMERSISNSTSGERDFHSSQQSIYNDLHGTSSWVGVLDCRCIEPPVVDRRLPDQPSFTQRSTSANQLPTYTGRLCPQNKQVIEKVLFTLRRQQSNCLKRIEHSMDQRATSPTSSHRSHPESNSEDDQRSSGSCTNTSKMVPLQVQNNASSNSELSNTRTIRSSTNQRKDNEGTLKPTTRNHGDGKDKYKEGEQLYRELAELTRLDSTAIDQLIAGINPETWRKRRAGLTPLANYLKQNNINTSTLLGNKPDVELVNALAWYKDLGGPKLQQ
ncbi:MAG: hypothetical protein EZS28_049576, partial [Streblomastix strix]